LHFSAISKPKGPFTWAKKENGLPNAKIRGEGVIEKGPAGKGIKPPKERLANSSLPFHKRKVK